MNKADGLLLVALTKDVLMGTGGIPGCLHSQGDEMPPGVTDQLHQGPHQKMVHFSVRSSILSGFLCL